MNYPQMKLVVSGVLLLLAGAILVVFYIPLVRPASAFASQGTVIARTFQAAHDIGTPGYRPKYLYGMHANAHIAVDEQYLIDIRLDSGEVVRSTWPVPTIDRLPLGQRVSVTCERRGFPPFWHKTYVRKMTLVPTDGVK